MLLALLRKPLCTSTCIMAHAVTTPHNDEEKLHRLHWHSEMERNRTVHHVAATKVANYFAKLAKLP